MSEPLLRDRRLPLRFWEKVAPTIFGCWYWTGGVDGSYGVTWSDGRLHKAHRLAYERLVGPIPDGLQLDHVCRNRACVNPRHLHAVTQRENIRRGSGASARQARKTHCKRGHILALVAGVRRVKGHRGCGECRGDRWEREKARMTPERIEKANRRRERWLAKPGNAEKARECARRSRERRRAREEVRHAAE